MAGLKITHLPTGADFLFNEEGLDSLTESYGASWNPEKVFGKMDPILSYSNTERKIGFSILLTADSDKEQAEMLARIMYPTYSNNNALSLKEPPLLRIEFGKYLRSGKGRGLLCACESFDLERGSYYFQGQSLVPADLQSGEILIKFGVIPLHEYDLGWFQVTDLEAMAEIAKANTTFETRIDPVTKRTIRDRKTKDPIQFPVMPKIDENTKVYQFGSSTPKRVTFSNRIINQVFTSNNPTGLFALKPTKEEKG